MLTKRKYEELKQRVSLSPYKYGSCWKLCDGICCKGVDGEDEEYFLEFFPFEDLLVCRDKFPRINKYQVKCRLPEEKRASCEKTLYCYLAPSHPAFENNVYIGVFIDPEIEACPLTHNVRHVSKKFMRAAYKTWEKVLDLLPPQRVLHFRKQYDTFLKAKKIKHIWRFS